MQVMEIILFALNSFLREAHERVKIIYFKFIFFKYEQESTDTNINKIYLDIHQKQEIYKGLHQKSHQIKQSSITFVIF